MSKSKRKKLYVDRKVQGVILRRVAAPALGRFIESMLGVAPPEPEDIFDKMVERGTGLFGTRSDVEDHLGCYATMGVKHMAFISRFGGMPAEAAERSLRALAPAA